MPDCIVQLVPLLLLPLELELELEAEAEAALLLALLAEEGAAGAEVAEEVFAWRGRSW
jgi:hypothetical protein